MSETGPYRGGCHCGRVTFEATVDLDHVATCNCSRCAKLGWMITFTPAEKFTLLSGEDDLVEYRFNRMVIRHMFCGTCGIESFSRGTGPNGQPMVAVNVRCLEGVDPDSLKPVMYDGKSR